MRNIFIHKSLKRFYEKYPIILIDIGASGGISKKWEKLKKYLKVVGFEPDKRAFDKLCGSEKLKFINTAVAKQDGEITLNLAKSQGCSSVFLPDVDFLKQFPDAQRFDFVKSVKLSAKRLSLKLLQTEGVDNPDFIKLDTQGYELEILNGGVELAEDYLFGIEAEVEFMPIYLDQPLFGDIDKFLRQKGFYLFDLKRYYWNRNAGTGITEEKGQIILGDALYFKTYEKFFQNIRDLDPLMRKAKIFKAVSICLLYGIYDYALYLSKRFCEDGFIDGKERGLVYKAVGKRKAIIKIKGIERLASIFYKAYKHLNSNKWYFADEEIGNG